jgi:hypothetical protein
MPPVRISTSIGQQVNDLLPAPLGGGPLESEGFGNRLTGRRQLQGQPLGMYRGSVRDIPAWGRRVGQEGHDNGGDERGMQERLHGTGMLGVDLVQAVHGLVHLDAQFDLPPDPADLGYLPSANPGWKIRPGEAVARRRVDTNEAEMQLVLGAPHPNVCIDGPVIKKRESIIKDWSNDGAPEKYKPSQLELSGYLRMLNPNLCVCYHCRRQQRAVLVGMQVS